MSPRPLVLHDAFAFPGGGELVAVTLARAFEAELLTGRFDPAAFPDGYFAGRAPASLEARARYPLAAKLSLTLAMSLAFEGMPPVVTPLAIHSGALTLLAHGRIHGPQLLYCHTPPRILYDHRDFYLARQPRLRRASSCRGYPSCRRPDPVRPRVSASSCARSGSKATRS